MSPRRNHFQRRLKSGFASRFEERIAKQLKLRAVPYEYEPLAIPFIQPQKQRRYKPDFILPNGIIVETKGRWVTADRQKIKWVKETYPNLDLRMVFCNSNQRISKQSKTTYAIYANNIGVPFADREIPDAWLEEKSNKKSLKIIKELRCSTS